MGQIQETALELEFNDNRLLPLLFGEKDRYLQRIEDQLKVTIHGRGNRIIISGPSSTVTIAKTVLNKMYARLEQGQVVSVGEIDAAIRMLRLDPKEMSVKQEDSLAITTRRRVIMPRSPGQSAYIEALQNYDLVFGIGPAGTGKTYLAAAMGISALLSGKVERIILSRPVVEAGEKLGFLPGDVRDKVDPYLRPLYDAIHDMLLPDQLEKRLISGEIEIAPLAFMRGRTLSRAYVILDEGQNTTLEQMKMFLTRLGQDSKMVITGDLTQIDLPKGTKSGLVHALDTLKEVPGIGFLKLGTEDIMRHDLVSRIIKAYDDAK